MLLALRIGDARLAAKSRTRTSGSWAMHGSARARLARKVQFTTSNMSRNSRKILLVTGCERSVQGRYRNSAVKGGQLPGATAGAHAAGLAIAIAVVMALAGPRIRLRLPVPVASRRARSLAWRLRMRNR